MNITLEQLSKHDEPCEDGIAWFEKQEDKSLCGLAKQAIKEKGEALNYCGWGLCAIMSKEQRVEWAIFSARQVEHLWKKDYPKEYATWNTWASGEDRSEFARAAAWAAARAATGATARAATGATARAAAWAAAWAATGATARAATGAAAWAATWDAAWDAAKDKTLSKILRYGVKLLMEGK